MENTIMSKRMRRTWMLCALAAVTAGALVSGCSSVPRVDSGSRGLFQPPSASSPIGLASLPELVPGTTAYKSDTGFAWPLNSGKVSSLFGTRKREFHEGIDIRANRGTPIFAARDGEVIYSARKIRGYGNMIVIKHDDDFATVYAHNRKNLVKRGERVTQGQLIGYVGATGKATGPHLHFEIRKREIAHDPLLYLPQIRDQSVASK